MDKVVLNSKLPGDLVDLIMAFKPRDRDMKSPTAALINEALAYDYVFMTDEYMYKAKDGIGIYFCHKTKEPVIFETNITPRID